MSKSESRNYLSGSEEDREVLRGQLTGMYEQSGFIIVGSIGRQAMYASFAWPSEPLSLRSLYDFGLGESNPTYRRDIDAVCPWEKPPLNYGEYEVDLALDLLFQSQPESSDSPLLKNVATSELIPLDRRVIGILTA
jgi:hypothetical protein